MTVLNREQIDQREEEVFMDESVFDTARAYHDLRDAVLTLAALDAPDAPVWYGHDAASAWASGYEAALREVVARVERGES